MALSFTGFALRAAPISAGFAGRQWTPRPLHNFWFDVPAAPVPLLGTPPVVDYSWPYVIAANRPGPVETIAHTSSDPTVIVPHPTDPSLWSFVGPGAATLTLSSPTRTVVSPVVYTAAPATPTGLAASVIRNGTLDLATVTWNLTANATTYQLDRASNVNFIGMVTFTWAGNVKSSLQALSRLANYYYRISAINAIGTSAPSATAHIVTP